MGPMVLAVAIPSKRGGETTSSFPGVELSRLQGKERKCPATHYYTVAVNYYNYS